MYYLTQHKRNQDAINLIKDVLGAHVDMKKDRERELEALILSSEQNHFFEIDREALEKSIETADIQISTIQYTLEYVKLIIKTGELDGC
jgi:hypothetical protein